MLWRERELHNIDGEYDKFDIIGSKTLSIFDEYARISPDTPGPSTVAETLVGSPLRRG